MRPLTKYEERVKQLCLERNGSDPRDNVFFLDSGEAIFQSWGLGYDIWVSITNVGGWLEDGSMTEEQVKDSQVG
jgi:hypothetical protein